MKYSHKLSIIVPVYNSLPELKLFLDSIKRQDSDQFELIIIDDGSTDGSSRLCKEFAAENSNRVIYRRTDNRGVSAARNLGLSLSTGRYVCFSDSDDVLREDYASQMLNAAIVSDADLVCAKYLIVDHEIDSIHTNDSDDFRDVTPDKIITNKDGCYLVDKIFKADIIKSNNISFNENIHMCEDMVFIGTYLQYCKKCTAIDKTLYYYKRKKDSSSRKKNNKKWFTIYRAFDALLKQYASNEEVASVFEYRYIYYLYNGKYRLHFISDQKIKEDIDKRLSEIRPVIARQPIKKRIKIMAYKYLWFVIFSVRERTA